MISNYSHFTYLLDTFISAIAYAVGPLSALCKYEVDVFVAGHTAV